ncbi:glutamate synthase large subunit [Flexibacterium corallicola]|uniref:glutamate synthase large subunit n=1 Tax=Flexibacterium corallicola TaxID=3037259 RepID=UPI00286F7886|nr:glutamate synthase large subunit [Pseudovibrio sp. M1P-2-3]
MNQLPSGENKISAPEAAVNQGLYQPSREHDACGVGFIANIKGVASHYVVQSGLRIVENLTHRGAVGADPLMGDGAGMLVQIPHDFFREECAKAGFDLPPKGQYGAGFVFLPSDEAQAAQCISVIERCAREMGVHILGWRNVPVDNSPLSKKPEVAATEPVSKQVFVSAPKHTGDKNAGETCLLEGDELMRRLYVLRKVISNQIRKEVTQPLSNFYIVSLCSRTIVYKGMFLSYQLGAYYKDLTDPRFTSAISLVHQRFSTNTFPSWELAHPYRMVAHNGEINTLRGNVNWMAARQASVSSKLLGEDIQKLWPISYEGQSDTACFDNAIEFLVMGGYSLAHAAMTLIPEAWSQNPLMDNNLRAFYEYHAQIMEPWDGPAAVTFTDGRQIGATLDRNGLRPARYIVTEDGFVIMASESGTLDVPEEKIIEKWRLQPGKMFLIDFEEGRIIDDEELKQNLAKAHPYQNWLQRSQIILEDLPDVDERAPVAGETLLDRQQAFGYSQEDIKLLMEPMATIGQEAIGSMGTDTPLSVLSDKTKLLYTYFKQNFAQVTNPPIDPIREELVMSLKSFIGPRPNLFDMDSPSSVKQRLEVHQPILTNADLEKVRAIGELPGSQFRTRTLDTSYKVETGAAGMEPALEALCQKAEAAVHDGDTIIILSDRRASRSRILIPILLAVAAVHNHLIRKGLRTSVGLVLETGSAREVHHFCVLAGYGAEAINPYLAFETLQSMQYEGLLPSEVDAQDVVTRYIKSINKGILKVMSKMGISTYQSYCGAQIFDAVGLNSDFVDRYFFGTASLVEGIGIEEIAQETVRWQKAAYGDGPLLRRSLAVGGEYAYRIRGENHIWTPNSVAHLQHAVRNSMPEEYKAFAREINGETGRFTLRGLMRIKSAEELGRTPLSLYEVEPAYKIIHRFSTGAMSFGSISREAHTTLAIAMNTLGGKSNTGEGGEEAQRFTPLEDGSPNPERSAIKQVASGRFGVTAEYLVNADMIQIKVAQGAKPGEGGQLPGHKVDAVIAKVRHSTPGVGLISPPPHHDIYSIEDLAQLIFDLKNVNPYADISVKLVSEVGVGTVAAGVAKARADHITISGFDGGTGASPLTSLKHAGSPWELGLAETQQTLVLNGLRSRVALQVDGGLRTGRDVLVGALLGADEFGFSTAPLIAAGCLMMRKCHLNTCPVGIATQDPVLRRRFKGLPEHVISYFFYVAEELRTLMAELGVQTLGELIGHSEYLDQQQAIDHWKAKGLDYTKLLHRPQASHAESHHTISQTHPINQILDRALIDRAHAALEGGEPVELSVNVNNVDRCVGTMLSGEVARRYGDKGLKDDTIKINLNGTAGQSFGAFLARGITLDLTGDANDYVGKGLSGGNIIIRKPQETPVVADHSIIVGNTVLYGATSGEAYFNGVAGERFAVRNSGATAVVEGVGDHGCEYMTGGIVVVLGLTGRNFAAGMSGGVAYVLDEDGSFKARCNLAMVDLEPVPEEDDLLEMLHHHGGDLESKGLVDLDADMTIHDNARLHFLIFCHYDYTGSHKAQMILNHWEAYRTRFVKVMPVEYRRALEEMKEARLGMEGVL